MSLDAMPDLAVTSEYLRSYSATDTATGKESVEAYDNLCLQTDKFVKDGAFVSLSRYPSVSDEQQQTHASTDPASLGKMLTDLYFGGRLQAPGIGDEASMTDGSDLTPRLLKTPRGAERLKGGNQALKTLIGQWTVGEDPSAYRWPAPPSRIDIEEEPLTRQRTPQSIRKRPLRPTTSLTLPAMKLTSSLSQPRFHASSTQSRPIEPESQTQRSSSQLQPIFQDLPATQITRGRFGDRTAPSVRRMPIKKRAVGF